MHSASSSENAGRLRSAQLLRHDPPAAVSGDSHRQLDQHLSSVSAACNAVLSGWAGTCTKTVQEFKNVDLFFLQCSSDIHA